MEGVAGIRDAFRRKNYPVLFVLPTGGGKTYTFCYIADNAADRGNNVAIIVHRKELLLQASKSLRALGIDHGMISPHFTPAPHKMVQVASIDTLLIRVKKYIERCEKLAAAGKPLPPNPYKFKLVIYDEAHHVIKANKWGKLHALLGEPITLGVTATPVRGDGVGLGEGHGGIFKEMVIGPLVSDLIDMGMLINPTVFTSMDPPVFDDLKANKEGEYNAAEVEERVDRPVITGSAVAHYTEICPGATAIVFCASIKHAKHVVDEFNAAGYRFALLVGEPEMSDAERTEVNRKLASGELHGACTVALVDEGYDLPKLQCCIGLAPTASESRFLQRVGRIMRPDPESGKSTENTFYLDHVGDVGRIVNGEFKVKHGTPRARREWSLEGRKKGKKKPAEEAVTAKQCGKCFHVFEPADEWFRDPKCPKCGTPMPQKTAVREIEQVDGKLTKLQEEAEMQAKVAAQQRAAQAAAQSVDEMVKKLGYSVPRAQAIVKARADKADLRDNLIADLRAWHQTTGQSPLATFGAAISDIKKFKPSQLRDLRAKFDAHRAAQVSAPRPPVNAEIEF